MTDAAWSQYTNDLNAMTDAEIEDECRQCRDQVDEAESWLEAVVAWEAEGSRVHHFKRNEGARRLGRDYNIMTDAAWSQYTNDLNAMTDAEIEDECRQCRDQVDEAESWLEAVVAWEAEGSRVHHFKRNEGARRLGRDYNIMTDAAWSQYTNDLNAMTDAEIEDECRQCRDQVDEAESWLEAVVAWEAAGKPRPTTHNIPER